jgi:hypothetical protein
MSANELLFWLSARRSGSWTQFRSAVEEILPDASSAGPPPTLAQRLRFHLQQLAHVEFYSAACENGWRVTPPVLALSTHPEGQIGVLSGARLPSQIGRFCKAFDGFISDFTTAPEQPDVIRVQASQAALLIERAGPIGLRVQLEAPLALLSSLPNVLQLHKWRARPAVLPKGHDWQVSIFQIRRRHYAWKESSVPEAFRSTSGLFRFTRYQRAYHYLKLDGQILEIGGQVGKFFLLGRRRNQVVGYSRSDLKLTVPAICRPPLPVDRALILCSGRLPVMDKATATLAYSEITEDIAGHAASILCPNRL